MAAIVVSIAATISFLAYISPPKDEIESFDYPPEFSVQVQETALTGRQTGNARPMSPIISCGTLGRRRTEKRCFRN